VRIAIVPYTYDRDIRMKYPAVPNGSSEPEEKKNSLEFFDP
jgi:hypothetical protein